MRRSIFALIMFCVCVTCVLGEPLRIGAGFSQAQAPQPEVLLTTSQLTMSEVLAARFAPLKFTQIRLQPHESAWLRYELVSAASESVSLVARHEFPWTDRAEFFVLRDDRSEVAHTVGGDAVTGKRHERLPLVHFEIAPRERLWVYLNIATVARTSALLHIYEQGSLAPRIFLELLGQGLFIGIAVMLLIFHLNLYLATRDRVLLGYLAYLTAVGLFLPLRSGILPQLLFGSHAEITDTVSVFMVTACYFTGVYFVRRFLALRAVLPRLDQWARYMQWLMLAPACALLVGRRESFFAANFAAFLVGPPLLLLGVYQALKNKGQAVYFVAGYSLPIIAAITDNMVENGVLPHFTGRNEMLPAAMVLEFLLFALIIYHKLADSELARSRDRERLTRVRAELAFARSIQNSLLPALQQKFGNTRFQAAYRSEKDVGSDYFDVVSTGENTICVLVTGTGTEHTSSLASALDTSAVRMAFRNSLAGVSEPSEAIASMFRLLEPVTRARPVAVTYVVMNIVTGIGRVYCQKNPSPVLVRADGSRTRLFATDDSQSALPETEFELRPGDYLVITTAGLTRRMNLLRDPMPPAERIQKIQSRPQRQKLRRSRRAKEDLTMVALSFEVGTA